MKKIFLVSVMVLSGCGVTLKFDPSSMWVSEPEISAAQLQAVFEKMDQNDKILNDKIAVLAEAIAK